MEPYAPRPIEFLGIRRHDDWRLKHYSIVYGASPYDGAESEPGISLLLPKLPHPAVAPARPGVGFLISHLGRTANYCVLGWWDRENELPLRVAVRSLDGGSNWRPAAGPESVCVWDLQVVAFERDAYVDTVLNADGTTTADAVDRYLERTLTS
ncbi:MAG: hypothetical protein ABFS14_07605 [Gemmatimonadota bacterium]